MIIFKQQSANIFAIAILFTFSYLGIPYAYSANSIPTAPKINAQGYLLLDFNSGQVLLEKNADTRMEPASLTKMMSAYVITAEIENGHINSSDLVNISNKAWRMGGSRMFVEAGKKVSVEELLKGVIIHSGNDATVALAEFVAGSEEDFVVLMNKQAKLLGLNDTHFSNSTGLPHDDHYSTPRDMAALGRAIVRDFPDHYRTYSTKVFKYNNIEQKNRNLLLFDDKFVDGIKTGHTDSAGYCLVASALRDKMRLISVVLGTESEKARAQESQKILNYGFQFFETHLLYAANEPLTQTHIWKGESDVLPLGLTEDLFITIPKGEYKNLEASMSINAEIIAPAQKGRTFGTVNITLGHKNYAVRKLIALIDIGSGGFFHSIIDTIKLAIN